MKVTDSDEYGSVRSSKTFLYIYHTTRRHNLQDNNTEVSSV